MWDLIVSVPDHCLSLFFVAVQASLSLTWSQTPEDRFSHDMPQFLSIFSTKFVLKCAANFENRLTNILFLFPKQFLIGILHRQGR